MSNICLKNIARKNRLFKIYIVTKTIKKPAGTAALDMPLLETRQKSCDLTGAPIADIFLQILGHVAHGFIRQRQYEGV